MNTQTCRNRTDICPGACALEATELGVAGRVVYTNHARQEGKSLACSGALLHLLKNEMRTPMAYAP